MFTGTNARTPNASATRMEGMLRCSVMRKRNICRRARSDRYDAQTKIDEDQSALVADRLRTFMTGRAALRDNTLIASVYICVE